jgi:aldose 1-epimerase
VARLAPAADAISTPDAKSEINEIGRRYLQQLGGLFCFEYTLGHFHTLFLQEDFRRMLVNGILRTAHYEVPESGAPCAHITEAKQPPSSIKKETIGRTKEGTSVEQYTLINKNGLEVKVLTYGATITTVKTPDRDGQLDCITLHLDPPSEYLKKRTVMGTIVGRFANRIAGAKFTLDGVEYAITANLKNHHIHGGKRGFNSVVWSATSYEDDQEQGVRLVHVSPDGDEGYPGKLEVTVVYALTGDNCLKMEYSARTDKPTHINLTNHAYWNLAGADSPDVFNHELFLNADQYLSADDDKFPTGEIRSVEGTPMDFTKSKKIGSDVESSQYGFYDHCYVLNKDPKDRLSLAARVVEPKSGRVMEVLTTQPGVQLYTGNKRALCLETQHYPNSPNEPQFPSTVLRPGERYHETTIHKFSVQ